MCHVFFLSSELKKKSAAVLGDNLASLYHLADYQFHTLYHGNSTIEKMNSIPLASKTVNEIFAPRNLADSVNESIANFANTYNPKDVMEKLGTNDLYDPVLRIIPGHGKNFDYVYDVLGSTEATYKFFNEHFNVGFHVDDGSMSEYVVNGVRASSANIIELRGCYYIQSASGK